VACVVEIDGAFPSPLAGEGVIALAMTDEGSPKKKAAALSLALHSEPTPHPSRFARHLLPQGEKGSRPINFNDARH